MRIELQEICSKHPGFGFTIITFWYCVKPTECSIRTRLLYIERRGNLHHTRRAAPMARDHSSISTQGLGIHYCLFFRRHWTSWVTSGIFQSLAWWRSLQLGRESLEVDEEKGKSPEGESMVFLDLCLCQHCENKRSRSCDTTTHRVSTGIRLLVAIHICHQQHFLQNVGGVPIFPSVGTAYFNYSGPGQHHTVDYQQLGRRGTFFGQVLINVIYAVRMTWMRGGFVNFFQINKC